MSLLSSGASSAKFPSIGARVGGRVVKDAEERQVRNFTTGQLEVWDDGNPKMQLVITVDTGYIDPSVPDDDGLRSIYVKGKSISDLRQVTRKLRVNSIKEGGIFFATYVRNEPTAGQPRKVYDFEYEPPVANDPVPVGAGPAGTGWQQARGNGWKPVATPAQQGLPPSRSAQLDSMTRRPQDEAPPF